MMEDVPLNGKKRFAKMANFFNRSSFGGFSGSSYPISGVGNSSAFHSNSFGFECF